MIHEIKCLEKYFTAEICGEKTFEVRKDDRGYKVGDFLAINEVKEDIVYEDSIDYIYTGRSSLFYICYILDDPDYCKPDYVVLGLAPCRVMVADRITDLTIMVR